MARKRFLARKVWDDEPFVASSAQERLLFIGLITYADDYGHVPVRPGLLRKWLFGEDEDVTADMVRQWRDNVIARFENVKLYTVDGQEFVELANWKDYQDLKYQGKPEYPFPDGTKEPTRSLPAKKSETGKSGKILENPAETSHHDDDEDDVHVHVKTDDKVDDDELADSSSFGGADLNDDLRAAFWEQSGGQMSTYGEGKGGNGAIQDLRWCKEHSITGHDVKDAAQKITKDELKSPSWRRWQYVMGILRREAIEGKSPTPTSPPRAAPRQEPGVRPSNVIVGWNGNV